jgi:hypothetical protein
MQAARSHSEDLAGITEAGAQAKACACRSREEDDVGFGGIFVLFYFLAVGLAFAGAGLIDLMLVPFRPLLPVKHYVDTIAVEAKKIGRDAAPLRVDHYDLAPPTGGDWYHITEREPAARYLFTVPESGADGARELFIRNPTARRPSAVRKLAGTKFADPPNGYASAPPKGRTEPAAFLRIDQVAAGDGELRPRLAGFIEGARAGPMPAGLLNAHQGRYQIARHDEALAAVGGLSCLRDEFVYLWMEDPGKKDTLSRRLEFTMACADPACPGQVISLVVRGKADSRGELERQGRAFFEGFRVDPARPPVCGAR